MATEKEQIREVMKQKRKDMGREENAGKSSVIAKKIIGMPEFEKATTIMLYFSKKTEVQTRGLIEEAVRQGKTVLLPVTEENGIRPCYFEGFDKVVKGNFGILEPENKKTATEEIDLVVVPGIAFDKYGVRVGFGMGFYDKFLENTKAKKIAPAFEVQLLDKLPREQHDVLMHTIITEKRVIRNG